MFASIHWEWIWAASAAITIRWLTRICSKSTGSSMGTISAPAAARARVASSNAEATAGLARRSKKPRNRPSRIGASAGAGQLLRLVLINERRLAAEADQHQPEVIDGAGDRTDLVKTRGERKHSIGVREYGESASCRRPRRTMRAA